MWRSLRLSHIPWARAILACSNGNLKVSRDGGTSWTTYDRTNGLGTNYVEGVYAVGDTIYAATGDTYDYNTGASSGGGLKIGKLSQPSGGGAPVAQPPIAGTPTVGTAADADGVVTGAAAFTDPGSRTLTYSTTGISDGGGTVTVDSGTGAYVYTPTQTQRRNATGSTTDTFTLTASNGVRTTDQTVTVTVSAGTPVAGGYSVLGGPPKPAPSPGRRRSPTRPDGP